jgi:ketosteroid isomerase-like protein
VAKERIAARAHYRIEQEQCRSQPSMWFGVFYDAFGGGDVAAVLTVLDEDIDGRVPENLPRGDFPGREGVGRFFASIGENWDGLAVDVEDILSGDERLVMLARSHGKLRATGEETGHTAAHAWAVRSETPTQFAEYVNAPLTLPAAHVPTS